ncbi:MAG: LuxR C-terminal-related transcriptional regulator [Cyanobacteriota bacterium]
MTAQVNALPMVDLIRDPAPGAAERDDEGVLLVTPRQELAGTLLRGLNHRGYRLRHLPDGLSVLLALREHPWPMAIVLASDLPDVSGLDVCSSLRSFGYRGHLLLLMRADQSAEKVAGFDAGADDVIDQSAGADELAARLRAQNRRLRMGRRDALPPARMAPLAEPMLTLNAAAIDRGRGHDNPLTPREQEVLEQMVLGLGNGEIAERLFLSLETVKTHVRNLMGKLKARHRTQAVIVALQSGYCLLPSGGAEP